MKDPFPGPEDDYLVVSARVENFFVTREVGTRVIEAVNARDPERWVRFGDLHGLEVSVRVDLIDYVRECTAEQHGSWRAFRRARRLEQKEDRRPWEDDD
jgi:hypothetical protein